MLYIIESRINLIQRGYNVQKKILFSFFMIVWAIYFISFLSNEKEQASYELSIAKTECLVGVIRKNMTVREMYKKALIDLETMNSSDDLLKMERKVLSNIN